MIINKDLFFKCQKTLDQIPFTQTQSWLDSSYSNITIEYIVDNIENTKIAMWGVVTNHKIVGRKLIVNGIATNNNVTANDYKEFFSNIVKLGNYDRIDISDIQQYSTAFEIGARRSGFTRPVATSLCPMSILVNLDSPVSYSRMWKRNVKKSIEQGNKFVVIEQPTLNDAEEFISLFIQLKERKNLAFNLTAEAIMSLLQSRIYKLFFIENKGKRICARIEYSNGDLVYDTYAANGYDALKTGAIYHIQQAIFEYFKENGYKYFDYGRISPSNDYMDNIYVSKSQSGGVPILYNGEWLYSKSKIRSFIYAAYIYVYKNKRMY